MNLVHSKHRYATKMHVETYGYNLKLYSRYGDTGKEPWSSPSLFSPLHHFRDPHIWLQAVGEQTPPEYSPSQNEQKGLCKGFSTSDMLPALGLVYPTQGPLRFDPTGRGSL